MAYLLNQGTSSVSIYRVGKDCVSVERIQANYPILPTGSNTSQWMAAEIRVSPNGRFLWTTSRRVCESPSESCNGTITTFRISGDGTSMHVVAHTDSGGHCPRVFEVDPTGSWLVVGNGGIEKPWFSTPAEGIRNVRVLRINETTGVPARVAAGRYDMGWGSFGSPGGIAITGGHRGSNGRRLG